VFLPKNEVTCHQLSVPNYRLIAYSCLAFSVAGPTVWNSLPKGVRHPECSVDSCRQSPKRHI